MKKFFDGSNGSSSFSNNWTFFIDFIISASALKCWHCDSSRHPSCGYPFEENKLNKTLLVDCHSIGGEAVCLKIVRKYYSLWIARTSGIQKKFVSIFWLAIVNRKFCEQIPCVLNCDNWIFSCASINWTEKKTNKFFLLCLTLSSIDSSQTYLIFKSSFHEPNIFSWWFSTIFIEQWKYTTEKYRILQMCAKNILFER